jgi:hypothetical protein
VSVANGLVRVSYKRQKNIMEIGNIFIKVLYILI